jgi:hypothetical protein
VVPCHAAPGAAALPVDITRQTPLLPQTSSKIERNNLVDASDIARTLRSCSAPPTTWRRTQRIDGVKLIPPLPSPAVTSCVARPQLPLAFPPARPQLPLPFPPARRCARHRFRLPGVASVHRFQPSPAAAVALCHRQHHYCICVSNSCTPSTG